MLQETGGTFILKIFDMFLKSTDDYIYLLSLFYNKVYIIKPQTSRLANSEKYIICKGFKFDQGAYDSLFHNIENNLRELGFGDVSVNKKMKDMNKLLYDILLKIDENERNKFKINKKLAIKYFNELNDGKDEKYLKFETYFGNFYNFCFDKPLDNVLRDAIKFRN